MSAVSILTPVVVAAWPMFSAVVVAAATSLGYTVVADVLERWEQRRTQPKPPRAWNCKSPIPNW